MLNEKISARSWQTVLRKSSFLILCALIACATSPNTRTVKIDSEPHGARVFFGIGPNEDRADLAKNFIGVTPLEWTPEANGDGTFKYPGILIYSMGVRPAAVFTCEPPSGSTNLFAKRQVFHGGAMFVPPDKIPEGVFFDLTKP